MNEVENTKQLLSVCAPEWPFRSINFFQRLLFERKFHFFSVALNIPFNTGHIKPEHTDLFSIFDADQLELLRSNPKYFFIFDYMKEGTGYRNYNFYELITKSAYKHNIPFNKIVFGSSNLIEQQAYDEWLSKSGVKDKFHIFSCNFWASTYFNKTTIDKTVSNLRKSYNKDYLCLNRRFRQFRFLSVYSLFKSPAFTKGLISFDKMNDGRYQYISDNLKKIYDMDLSIEEFGNFNKILPLILDRSDFEVNWVDTMPDYLFHSTLYSLVNETIIEDVFEGQGPSLFYSEKTFKPMFYNHPVLIFGQPGINKHLEHIGFKRYDKYFNLDFDNIYNGRDRINAVIKEVERVSSLLENCNVEQKIEWVLQDRDVLEHNQKAMTDNMFNDLLFVALLDNLEQSVS